MCKCTITLKACLGALGILFWAIAAGLMFIGVWIFKEYQDFDDIAHAKYTLIPATIIMASAVFLFLLGIIGCVGAFKEQKCLLALFFSILLLIFVGLVAASALAYFFRHEVDDKLQEGIDEALQNYTSPHYTQQVDFMQKKLKCCGSANYTDWQSTPWYLNQTDKSKIFPNSCCVNQDCKYNASSINGTGVYFDGCHEELKDLFVSHLAIIFGVGAGFALLQILGMICSCVLICRRKSQYNYVGLREPDGMRV